MSSEEEEDNILIKVEEPNKEVLASTLLSNKNGTQKARTWKKRRYTYEEIKEFIGYVENDYFTVNGAARRAGIPEHAGSFYYKKFLADPNREIPVPKPLDYHPFRRIHNVHTQFIAGLYKKDRCLKIREIHEELSKEFPDLKIKEASIASHIKVHLADIYKTTASYNGENNRKLFPHHSEFIANIIKTEPSLPICKIRDRLVEKYPGLELTESSLSHHVARHLSDVYNASLDKRKYCGRKIYPKHIEFVQDLFEKNPKTVMEHVYKAVNKEFPYLKLKSSKPLAQHLRKNYSEFYESHIKKSHHFNRRITDEHSTFLRDHHRKYPKKGLASVHKAFLKAFPGITFKKDSIHQHLKKKHDIYLL